MNECLCAECTPYDTVLVPTEEHEDLVAEVRDLIAKWQPRMRWLDGWTVHARPIAAGCGNWTMRIDSASYIRSAVIEVRPEADVDRDGFLPDEHSLELVVVHELCHVLFEGLRACALNQAADPDDEVGLAIHRFMVDAEEVAAWSLARTLAAQEAQERPVEARKRR